VPATAATQAYSREEVRRLLSISERQLRGWEQQKLVEPAHAYGFRELLALRTLVKLRRNRVPSVQIRRALSALRLKLRHIENPLTELKLYADGKKIRVEVDGRAMEAVSGQLLLDFDEGELCRLLEFPVKDRVTIERDRRLTAERWFQRGLELEQTGAAAENVIEAYQKALELDPKSAGALVNLGTIHFNARRWPEAERYYREALEVDPDYALAHFDLANLYDERGDRVQALVHYESALRISPNYADAHYNLALLYQGSNQPMKAVRHWSTYLKLDPASHWATIARRELAKLRQATVLLGSRQNEPRG
jgi:tetratricopeptide (TPR) repeat protein